MANQVFLHVGSPKTGTSFLQDALLDGHEQLAEKGILYPAERFDQHFLAALDLMGLKWGGLEEQAVGAWDRLAAQVRAWPGTAIVSHEILARATPEEVARAAETLGGELHVVLSARDLGRQIPAEWQENIKHRRVKSYAEFIAGIRDPDRASILAQWFWGVQETPDILARWGAGLPPERMHLVTVPHAGADPDELGRRFAAVLGLDPGVLARRVGARSNASLGVAEVAVVRDLNEQVNGPLANEHYRALVRENLVHRNLATERTSAPLSLPNEVWEWATSLSRQWVERLGAAGYDVVGDLADLVPAAPLPFVDPDAVPVQEKAPVLLRALTASLLEGGRLREEIAARDAEIADLSARLDRFYGTRTYQLKERFVARAEDSAVAARALDLYRRLRD